MLIKQFFREVLDADTTVISRTNLVHRMKLRYYTQRELGIQSRPQNCFVILVICMHVLNTTLCCLRTTIEKRILLKLCKPKRPDNSELSMGDGKLTSREFEYGGTIKIKRTQDTQNEVRFC